MERIEAVTDDLAVAAYEVISADELDELVQELEPTAHAARGRLPHAAEARSPAG